MLETENAIQNYNNYENYFGICLAINLVLVT
jgi:hypothetical protein